MIIDKKEIFIQYDLNRDIFYDSIILVKLIIDICNPEMKVSIQNIQDNISKVKSVDYNYNIIKIIGFIKSTIDLIQDIGKMYNNLIKYIFLALLIVLNSIFI